MDTNLTHDLCASWGSFGAFRANVAFILSYGDRGPQLHGTGVARGNDAEAGIEDLE
jgi:hypothetical protein